MLSKDLLSLKEVQAVAALVNTRIGKLVARELNISQPALSRLITSAQRKLNARLFETGWSGSIATPEGEIAGETCQIVLDQMRRAEDRLRETVGPIRFPLTRLKWSHFETVAMVADTNSASVAAASLRCSQSLVSQLLRDVHDVLGGEAFTRTAYGLRPNKAALELAKTWNRVRPLVRNLPEQINSASEVVGRIAVGMLPFSGQYLIAQAFGEIVTSHPGARLRSLTGPYAILCNMLRDRQIDVIVGTLRGKDCPSDLLEFPLYAEQFVLVARRDHPCMQRQPSLADLIRYSWIVGPSGTPVRRYFEELIEADRSEPPTQISEVLTFSDAEETIARSNCVGVLCYAAPVLRSLRADLAVVLPSENPKTAQIGLTTVRGGKETPSIAILRELLELIIERSGFCN